MDRTIDSIARQATISAIATFLGDVFAHPSHFPPQWAEPTSGGIAITIYLVPNYLFTFPLEKMPKPTLILYLPLERYLWAGSRHTATFGSPTVAKSLVTEFFQVVRSDGG